MWKLPCYPSILNTVTVMAITVLPIHILCTVRSIYIWTDTSCFFCFFYLFIETYSIYSYFCSFTHEEYSHFLFTEPCVTRHRHSFVHLPSLVPSLLLQSYMMFSSRTASILPLLASLVLQHKMSNINHQPTLCAFPRVTIF